jgi:hypothetical protein
MVTASGRVRIFKQKLAADELTVVSPNKLAFDC